MDSSTTGTPASGYISISGTNAPWSRPRPGPSMRGAKPAPLAGGCGEGAAGGGSKTQGLQGWGAPDAMCSPCKTHSAASAPLGPPTLPTALAHLSRRATESPSAASPGGA
jgi:hypothetical protein